MAQISTLPLVAGTDTPTTVAAGAAEELPGLSAEGQVIGFSFDETLKQLLDSQEGGESMLLFAMQQPVVEDPQLTPQALISEDGNLLPLTLQADGKTLPVMLKPELMVQLDGPQTGLPQPQIQTQTQIQVQVQSLARESVLPNLVLTSISSEQKPLLLNELVGPMEGRSLVDPLKTSEMTSANQSLPLTQTPISGASAPRGALTLPLNLPVGQPGWDQGLGERVQWMVNQNIQQAEIKLTPPNLGPLEIKISVQHDQTHVTFLAAQAPTREALEASIPRLREMLGDINLNLANVNVGQQQSGGSERGNGADNPAFSGGDGVELGATQWSTENPGTRLSGQGLLDTYA
ncbi:MAG: flagellar hook-length control protein FliK [Candidatus Thiodiazotropha sp.]